MSDNRIFFFTMKAQSRLRKNCGQDIAIHVGFMRSDTIEQAREKIWEQYGSDSSYSLDVCEVENGETESFCVYYK